MKNQDISYFKEDLERENKEMVKLLSLLGKDVQKADGKIADIYFEGKSVEVKFESRDIRETKNVAYEYYSSEEMKTMGGPWKSLQNGVDLFWSYFPKNGIVVSCEVVKLVDYLNDLLKKEIISTSKFRFHKKNSRQSGGYYTTTGWAISIRKLIENGVAKAIKLNKPS